MIRPTSRPEALIALEAEIGVLVRRIRGVIVERSVLVHPEMQPSSYMLLAYLVRHGAARAATLVGDLSLDKGAVSRQVTHLERLGLIARTPDPADGRATLLDATDDARRRMAAVADQRRELLDQQLAPWSDTRLEAFVAELSAYNAILTGEAT